MPVEELKALYAYGNWANARLFAVVSQMVPEQFVQPVVGQHASIRDLLVHMINAEWTWLGRCGGEPRGPALQPADFPDAASVSEVSSRLETYVRAFLSRLEDDDLARTINFRDASGAELSMTVGELMHQAANHGVHHRGQIALMLQWLGYDPGNLDLVIYLAERRGVSEAELRSLLSAASRPGTR